jgi:hypothetical protein
MPIMRRFLLPLIAAAVCSVSGCRYLTDGGTRVGFQLERGAGELGNNEGATYTVTGITPAISDDCTGPYRVQFDKVGGIVVWCYDNDSPDHHVVGGGSTSHSVPYVDTPRTWIIDKPAGAAISVDLQRSHGRPIIEKVY